MRAAKALSWNAQRAAKGTGLRRVLVLPVMHVQRFVYRLADCSCSEEPRKPASACRIQLGASHGPSRSKSKGGDAHGRSNSRELHSAVPVAVRAAGSTGSVHGQSGPRTPCKALALTGWIMKRERSVCVGASDGNRTFAEIGLLRGRYRTSPAFLPSPSGERRVA